MPMTDTSGIDQAAIRGLTRQLAEDLAWLEKNARKQNETTVQTEELHLSAALVRNILAPALEGQPAFPLHVAVVGGAGAGKSTVANFLCGSVQAEANPQAGFTRHPIAYAGAGQELSWPGTLGFLDGLQRLSRPEPANLDADVYQIRRQHTDPEQYTVLDKFVVWDCPDMTAAVSAHYLHRLIEIAGLADVVVYVASDERYNDEVPTQFLRLLLQAGKTVVACVTKMREADAPALVAHFQKEVLSRMPGPAIACMALPHLTAAQRADPVRLAAPYRIPLVNQVIVLGEPLERARRRSAETALRFLRERQGELLNVARRDLEALEAWRKVVLEGQIEFDARYRREFLTSARFRRFDEALVLLLDLLELPGVGKVLSTTLYVLRTPYRLVKGLFNRALVRPEATGLPERRVLEEALAGWLDLLRKEAARRATTHPFWQHIHQGFASGLRDVAHDRFEEAVRSFQVGLNDEVDRTARAIYEDLEKNPVALNSLRGTKLSLEVAAIGTTAITFGHNLIVDAIMVPVAASVMGLLVDLLGKQYVDRQREHTRARQEAMVTQYVSGPLKDWLTQWPATEGSDYEQLHLILRRFPPNVQQLETLVRQALAAT
jgi:hypothetical protein